MVPSFDINEPVGGLGPHTEYNIVHNFLLIAASLEKVQDISYA